MVGLSTIGSISFGCAFVAGKNLVPNPAVLLGDDVVYSEKPCLKQLIDVYNQYHTTILGCQYVAPELTYKYGIVDGLPVENNILKVKDLVEKPPADKAPSNLAILGRYIITPRIFDYLERTEKDAGGEVQLTDGLKMLAADEDMYAFNFEGRRYDVGSKQGFLEATVEYALRRSELKDEFASFLKKLDL